MRHYMVVQLGLAVLLTAAVTGCKEGGPGRHSYVAKPNGPKVRVAVVPFDSIGLQQENAARIVNEEVITSLLGTGMFEVVEPGMVYLALSEAGTRNAYGLDLPTMQKIQEAIGAVRAFFVGTVQEFGEVRVGPVSYPSISVSARVLDAQTGTILWAGSVSRTGAESEKLFGMGAVHSSGRLARAVVHDLLTTVDRQQLMPLLTEGAVPANGGTTAPAITTPVGPTGGPTGKEKFMDESAVFGEGALRGFLVEVPGLTRGEVTFRQHHFPIAEAEYQGGGLAIEVKLVDCLKREAALRLVKNDHPDETEGKFAGLPAFAGASGGENPGAYHLDVAAGRFALRTRGPETKKSQVEQLVQAVLQAMK